MRKTIFGPLIMAWVTLGACSDPTAPLPPLTRLDTLLLNVLQWQEFMAPAFVPAAATIPRAVRCQSDSSSAPFVCPPAVHEGLTLKLRYRLLDGSGETQSAFDPDATDAIDAVTEVSGRRAGTGDALNVVESRTHSTLRGLVAGRGPFLLGSTGTTTTFWRRGADSGSVTADLLITDLEIPDPLSVGGATWPRAGTVDVYHHGPGYQHTGPVDLRVVVTFDGTPMAKMVRTEKGVSRHCTWDLTPRDGEAGNGITCEPPPAS